MLSVGFLCAAVLGEDDAEDGDEDADTGKLDLLNSIRVK